MTKFVVCLLAFLSAAAQAATVRGDAAVFTHSCGYYSETEADVRIVYTNYDLPWGVIVQLVYGQGGTHAQPNGQPELPIEWRNQSSQVMASSAGYEWSTDLTLEIAQRSIPDFYKSVDFVVRIIYPDGHIVFDNGGSSAWGFYRLHHPASGPCTDASNPRPALTAATIERIARD
jgi:hypothetical protein